MIHDEQIRELQFRLILYTELHGFHFPLHFIVNDSIFPKKIFDLSKDPATHPLSPHRSLQPK